MIGENKTHEGEPGGMPLTFKANTVMTTRPTIENPLQRQTLRQEMSSSSFYLHLSDLYSGGGPEPLSPPCRQV